MDQITFSITTSSSSSSSSDNNHPSKTIRQSYTNSLHSVRKPTVQKPAVTKHFIAPLPPAPSKVYKVESSNFKQVVRMLTSTPEFQSPSVRRLKDIAPPPLVLSSIPKPSIFQKPPPPPPPPQHDQSSQVEATSVSPLSTFTLSPGFCKFLNETLETSRFASKSPVMDCFGSLSPLGSKLSPLPPVYDPLGAAIMSPLGFNLSPSSLSWCSSALLSPVSLSVFN